MSAPSPAPSDRISPAQAVAAVAKVGIYAEARDDQFFVASGERSQNLECLCTTETISYDAKELLHGAAVFVDEHGGEQYFYRIDRTEPTRRLTPSMTIHGEGDMIRTYPSPGYERIGGTSFKTLPHVTWDNHCRLIDLLMLSTQTPIPPEYPVRTLVDVHGAYGMMALTEHNAAIAFEDLYKDRFRYCKVWGEWLEWQEWRWATERTELPYDLMVRMIHELNREMGKGAGKASFAAGAERIARARRSFATRSNDWDNNEWLVNTPKGTIDLQTGRLSPHQRTDHITKCTNVAMQDGPRPLFDKFLQEITLGDGALAEYLQRALGSCLSGAIQDNFLLFWYGTGQNGKSVFGELVNWIFGDYSKVIPAETLMAGKNSGHLTELANLRGLRLAITSEVAEGCYWDEQRVKSLTGDKEISARYMHKDLFEYRRTHKHLVFGNNRPQLRIVDPAIKSRLHIVPFKAYFPADMKDPLLPGKLRTEAPSVLAWLVEGHSRWLEDGYLRPCQAVQDETANYFGDQSTPDMWLEECCRQSDGYRCSAKELYASFKVWKEGRGEGAMSQTRWGEFMGRRFMKTYHDGRVVYLQVELKPMSIFDAAR